MANRLKFDSHFSFVIDKYESGVSAKEIAKLLSERGCRASDTGIRKFLCRNGVTVRKSAEARRLMKKTAWNTGKTYKQKNPCKERSERMKGSKNPQWKGGVTSENLSVRNSKEYKEWRDSVFSRDNYTCVFCGARSSIGSGRVSLHADHILPFSTHKRLRLEPSNGRTLCKKCHKTTPTYGKNTRGSKD